MSRNRLRHTISAMMLAVISAAPPAAAEAATATFTGGPTVAGTATTSTLFKLNTASKTISCTGSTLNGSVAATTTGALPLRVGTLTPGFSGCSIVGGLGLTIPCNFLPLGFGWITHTGHTEGYLAAIHCHVYVTSQTTCRAYVSGVGGARMWNGPPTRFEIDRDHMGLLFEDSTNGSGGQCAVVPNDNSARFTNSVGGDVRYDLSPTNLALNVTP
jgi:hypothetical protein